MTKCFKCEKELEEDKDASMPFTSYGSGMSAVFDYIVDMGHFEVYICDDCIKQNHEMVQHVTIEKEFKKIPYAEYKEKCREMVERQKKMRRSLSVQGRDRSGDAD